MTFTVDVPISGVSVMLKLVAASLVVAPPMIANAAMAETMARSRARPQYAFIFRLTLSTLDPTADVPRTTKYHKGGGCTSLRSRVARPLAAERLPVGLSIEAGSRRDARGSRSVGARDENGPGRRAEAGAGERDPQAVAGERWIVVVAHRRRQAR